MTICSEETGLTVKIGDAVMAGNFTVADARVKAGFSAGKNRRFVMLLLGEEGTDQEFDPEAMLRKLGWERVNQEGVEV